MNPELANQLKDAGFPQPKRMIHTGANEVTLLPDYADIKDAYHPTLEELIDFSDGNAIVEELYEKYIAKAMHKLQGAKTD